MRCGHDVSRQILKKQVFAGRDKLLVVEFNQIPCLVLGPNAHYPVHLRVTRSQRSFELLSASVLQNREGSRKHILRICVSVCVCVCVCVRRGKKHAYAKRICSPSFPVGDEECL